MVSGARGEASSDLRIFVSFCTTGIPWSVLRSYSSASTKEKARSNVCERTELLEGESGRAWRAAGVPLFSVLGGFLGFFPFCAASEKMFGTGRTCSLGKAMGHRALCLGELRT